MDEIEMLCSDCNALVAFVAPDPEGEPTDDLMCVLCGAAISFGGWVAVADQAA
jgi:hypothetical protein